MGGRLSDPVNLALPDLSYTGEMQVVEKTPGGFLPTIVFPSTRYLRWQSVGGYSNEETGATNLYRTETRNGTKIIGGVSTDVSYTKTYESVWEPPVTSGEMPSSLKEIVLSDPIPYSEIYSTMPVSEGDWSGTGDIGPGTLPRVVISGVMIPVDSNFNAPRVRKTRWRAKFPAHGAYGGGVRVASVESAFSMGPMDFSPISLGAFPSWSNWPEGTALSGSMDFKDSAFGSIIGHYDYGATTGIYGGIVSPTISGSRKFPTIYSLNDGHRFSFDPSSVPARLAIFVHVFPEFTTTQYLFKEYRLPEDFDLLGKSYVSDWYDLVEEIDDTNAFRVSVILQDTYHRMKPTFDGGDEIDLTLEG